MFDAALDYLKTPEHLLLAIAMLMAVLLMFKGMRESLIGMFPFYRYTQPIAFAWAALIVARKLDWSIPEQTAPRPARSAASPLVARARLYRDFGGAG